MSATVNDEARAPTPYGQNALPDLSEGVRGTSRVSRHDEDSNIDRLAPLTGNGAAVAPVIQPVTMPGRQRRRPTIPARPSHVAGISLNGRQVSLAPQLDSIVSALRAGNLYVRPLGQLGHEPLVHTMPAPFTGTLQSYAFVTQEGVYSPHTGSDFYSTTYLDGTSTTLVGSETFNGLSIGLSGLLADGWAGTYLSFNVAEAANHLLSLGIQLQFWRDYLRVGASYVNANLSNLTFVAASALAAINVSRDATDLGAYGGPDAEELAQTHGIDFDRDGMRQVEIRQMYNKTLGLRLAGGSFLIAGLGRLDLVRGRQKVFRTLVSTERARQMVFEGHGLKQYFIDRLRAMGWMREFIRIPNQHATDTFREGDEIIKTRSRTLTTSAIAGNLTVFAGLQGFMRGDNEITAHKLDDTHIEVVFNPTRIRDAGTYFYSPFGPEGDMGMGYARSCRQNFVFDLAQPEGLAAYHAAIDGKLPNRLQKLQPTQAEQRGDIDLKESVRLQNAKLPNGVKRNYVHFIHSRERRGGFGAYWRVVPRVFLPEGWINILARHHTRMHEQQSITDGELIDAADNRFSQRRDELLWYGTRTIETAAQRRHIIDDKNQRYFLGLTLEATLYDGCLRRLAANGEFIKKVNNLFEQRYAKFTRPGHKQQREVDIARMFAPAEVDSLAQYAKIWRGGESPLTQSEAVTLTSRLNRAALETRLGISHVRHMVNRVAQQEPGDARAAVVQKFVQRHGIRGFAMINKLVPDERGLSITTSSSSYSSTLQRASRLELQFYRPLAGGDGPESVRERFKEVRLGLKRIRRAQLDLADDPIIGEQGAYVSAELDAARESLYALLRIPPDGRGTLAYSLALTRHRRHSTAERRILYAIEDPQQWLRTADALCAQAQGRALPPPAAQLFERWKATQQTAAKLRRRLLWLRDPLTGISDDERQQRIEASVAALRRLVGSTKGHTRVHPTGLMNVGTIEPPVRAQLRYQLRPGRHDGLMKTLRRALGWCA